MKNRFKARAWLKKEKRMVEVQSLCKGGIEIDSNSTFPQYDGWYKTIANKDCVVMQCTGVCTSDEHLQGYFRNPDDTLIYDGDIIKCQNHKYIVFYDDEECCYMCKFTTNNQSFAIYFHECVGEIKKCGEIIGNIHEHQHLLDGDENV